MLAWDGGIWRYLGRPSLYYEDLSKDDILVTLTCITWCMRCPNQVSVQRYQNIWFRDGNYRIRHLLIASYKRVLFQLYILLFPCSHIIIYLFVRTEKHLHVPQSYTESWSHIYFLAHSNNYIVTIPFNSIPLQLLNLQSLSKLTSNVVVCVNRID